MRSTVCLLVDDKKFIALCQLDLCIICQTGNILRCDIYRSVGVHSILYESGERVGCLGANVLFIIVQAITSACLLLRFDPVLIWNTFLAVDEFELSQENFGNRRIVLLTGAE